MFWRKINLITAEKLIKNYEKNEFSLSIDKKKRTITYYDSNDDIIFKIRFALNLDFDQASQKIVELDFQNHIVLIIKSGIASIAFFENRQLIDHKVFRAYMVRKKQGKSQIKYLKTKGKSRAGSRVRLQETIDFFENINQRLLEYFKEYRIDTIAFSCSQTLIPYFFQSKTLTPFDKKDDRIYKIPKHIDSGTHENLLEVNNQLFECYLYVYKEEKLDLNHSDQNDEFDPDEGKEENW
jgi:hypothetical protein